MRRLVATGVTLLAVAGPLSAQGLRERVSSELFTFGTCGQPLCLDGSQLVGHGSHFIPATLTGAGSIINFLSNAIAVSVSNVPVSAASAGATFSFVGGQPVKTSSSAGPIFGERAQTLGRGRFFIGANVTGLHFERLRGVRLDNIVLNFGHQNIAPSDTMGSPDFENDLVQVHVGLNVDLLVSTVFASWGLVDGIDLGIAIPFVHTSVKGQSIAQILPFGSGTSTPHYFGTDVNGDPVLSAVAQTDAMPISKTTGSWRISDSISRWARSPRWRSTCCRSGRSAIPSCSCRRRSCIRRRSRAPCSPRRSRRARTISWRPRSASSSRPRAG
jgi:hypothetical protein